MVVVKADGYGHGMLPVRPGRPARPAPSWLGVATPSRGAGSARGRRHRPGARLAVRARRGPDPAGRGRRRRLRPVDRPDLPARPRPPLPPNGGPGCTSRSTPGCPATAPPPHDWAEVCAAAAEARGSRARSRSSASGPTSPPPTSPATRRCRVQLDAFQRAYEQARSRPDSSPSLRHLANSAAALVVPEARLDLVRVGHRGVRDRPGAGHRRPGRRHAAAGDDAPRPAGERQADRRRAPASRTAGPGPPTEPTTVGLVPLGYGDGIPRHAGNRAEVGWRGGRAPVRGRICMDQFVVELGPARPAQPGDEVIAVRPRRPRRADRGGLGGWCGTIGYEIVTRIGTRVPRRLSSTADEPDRAADGAPSAGRGPRPGRRLRRAGRRRRRASGSSSSGGSSASGSTASSSRRLQDVLRAPLRRAGVTTPDGVVLHTEIDEGAGSTT